jgi:hypothetical protein
MRDRCTHLQNSKPKRMNKKQQTTTLTGMQDYITKTSHHRKAEENEAINNINDNYQDGVI